MSDNNLKSTFSIERLRGVTFFPKTGEVHIEAYSPSLQRDARIEMSQDVVYALTLALKRIEANRDKLIEGSSSESNVQLF